ncbi:MAG: glycosyltransferase family A protein [Pyrinomonadaceae bacterium]
MIKLERQTYGNWEALLVDNNSNDGSAEIAQSLIRHDQLKVRYIFEPKQGIPNARNKGLSEAHGRYITFLDVDDEFTPTKLADQVAILEANPEVAMVYGLTRRVYLPHGRSLIQEVGIAVEGLNRPPYLAIDWLKMFFICRRPERRWCAPKWLET